MFKTGDITTFYDANKETVMKGLKGGTLPWNLMTKRAANTQVISETPEDCYDYAKAIEVKTTRTKPRSIALTNFDTQKSRDDMLLKTSDAYSNVILENTRGEREL